MVVFFSPPPPNWGAAERGATGRACKAVDTMAVNEVERKVGCLWGLVSRQLSMTPPTPPSPLSPPHSLSLSIYQSILSSLHFDVVLLISQKTKPGVFKRVTAL